MAKRAFLFWAFLMWAGIQAAAQRPGYDGIRGAANGIDTLSFSFQRIDKQSGDTVFLHVVPPSAAAQAYSPYLLRFFNKNLPGLTHEGMPKAGIAIIWFVTDTLGRCTGAGYDTTVSDPEIAGAALGVVGKMNDRLRIEPSTVRGRPVASQVKVQVMYQCGGEPAPKSPDGFKADVYSFGGIMMR